MEPTITLEPIAVKRTTAARMLDCGPTMVWKLCKAGELQTIKIGSDDRVVVESIRAYVQRRKIAP